MNLGHCNIKFTKQTLRNVEFFKDYKFESIIGKGFFGFVLLYENKSKQPHPKYPDQIAVKVTLLGNVPLKAVLAVCGRKWLLHVPFYQKWKSKRYAKPMVKVTEQDFKEDVKMSLEAAKHGIGPILYDTYIGKKAVRIGNEVYSAGITVMEDAGVSLASLRSPDIVEEWNSITKQLRKIFKKLKQLNIRHTDLHLGNILIDNVGTSNDIKLIDFQSSVPDHSNGNQYNHVIFLLFYKLKREDDLLYAHQSKIFDKMLDQLGKIKAPSIPNPDPTTIYLKTFDKRFYR